MNEWRTLPLVDLTRDQNISYGIVQPGKHIDSGIPILRVNNFQPSGLDLGNVLRVDKRIEKRHAKTRLEINDILLTVVGTTGLTCVVPKELVGWNVARAIAVIKLKPEISPRWVEICLKSKSVKQYLDDRANTTVQKTLNLKDVKTISIPIPDKNERNLIEAIAVSLDSKITLNRKLNETLEQMARALFQSWFVDFDPVKARLSAKRHGRDPERACMAAISGKLRIPAGKPRAEHLDDQLPTADELDAAIAALDTLTEAQQQQLAEMAAHFPADFHDSELGMIPDRWRTVPFSKHAEIKMGQSPKGETYNTEGIGIPLVNGPVEFGNYFTDSKKWTTSPTKICEPNDLIVCVRGSTTGRYVKSNGQYCIGRGVCAIRGRESQSFVDFIFKDNCARLLAMTTGSTFPNWSGSVLSEFNTVKPPSEIIACFDIIVSPMMAAIGDNEHQSRTLAELRDTLLPKLLSGELSVNAAEDAVEEATAL